MYNHCGKFARPIASRGFVHREYLTTKLRSPVTLIQAPAGCLLTESLAATLEQDGRQIVWLRFGWEDFDPATCLLSLVEAFQTFNEKVGSATLEKMSRFPGPLQGWPGLFVLLGNEIKECLPESITLVLENLQHPARSPLTLALICKHFLPTIPVGARVILISQMELPRYALQKQPEIVTSKDLRLSNAAIKRLFQASELLTENECLWDAVRLMDGNPVGLAGLCIAGQMMGEAYLQAVLRRQTTQAGLYGQIACDWLDTLDDGEIQSTGILLALGYYHPDINESKSSRKALTHTPWAQPLEAGWVRPRSLWLSSIETALKTSPAFRIDSIHKAAEYLCFSGCLIQGIGLFFASAAVARAADYLAQNVDEMLSQGQWELLKAWLERLPENLLAGQPRLLHATGEIKIAQGDLAGAAQEYRRASERYLQQDDQAGHVTSLLALSSLSIWQGDIGEAWSCAHKALQTAQSARLPRYEGSAELQIGLLALHAGDIPNAIPHLELAGKSASIAEDASLLRRVDELHKLAMEQEQWHQQLQQQHQRYLAAQQAERFHLQRLQDAIRAPLDMDDPAWSTQGWLQAPLNLKIGAALSTHGHMQNGKESLTGKIKAWLRGALTNGYHRKEDEFSIDGTEFLGRWLNARLEQADAEQPISPSIETGLLPQITDQSPVASTLFGRNEQSVFHHSSTIPAYIQSSPTEPPSKISKPQAVPSMAVYCLGPFGVYLDKQPVIEWPSSKGKSIFKYLVTNRERPVVKDVLMELFWPDVAPEAARNNLNVAIYGLRQALRQVQPSFSHILFQEDNYYFNPNLKIWVDCDAFTELLNSARDLERSGDMDDAIHRYCDAEALYQGDFMEEDRYEDWPNLQRQHLQDDYLNLLDRLIRHYFDYGDDHACTTMCRKLLAVDPCREEAHHYLMHIYIRQGHPHLALRQYHLCVKMLKEELDISPTPATTALLAQIRRVERN